MASFIADYVVVSDGSIEISRLKDGGFSSPINFHLGDTVDLASPSILLFRMFVHDGTSKLEFEIKVNDVPQLARIITHTGAFPFSCHEVINPNTLKHGNNTVHFHPMAGLGKMTFSDIVLFCQRSV